MGRVSEYSFISANLRAKISRILDAEFLLKCAEAKDLETLLMTFKDTDFAFLQEVYHKTADIKTCEKEVLDNEIAYNSYLFKHTKGAVRRFCESLALRYEADILKDVLRLWFDRTVRHRNIDEYTPYLHREPIVHTLPIDPILNADSPEAVAELLSSTPYGKVVASVLREAADTETLYGVETAVDAYVFRQMKESAEKLPPPDRRIAKEYTGLLIDIENLNRTVRLKHYFQFDSASIRAQLLPGGRRLPIRADFLADGFEEDVGGLVKRVFPDADGGSVGETTAPHFDRLLFVETVASGLKEKQAQKALGGNPFTVGTVIAFFILKRVEIRRIITLMNAKYYRLEKERIKELL